MNQPDRDRDTKNQPRTTPERPEPRERQGAPPIEREHETQQGALDEDEERRERERR